MITLEQYVGPHADCPDWTPERQSNATKLLWTCSQLELEMIADGVQFPDNPHTGNGVSGQTFGGFRPQSCTQGAPHSNHKEGLAVDRYDPDNAIDTWLMAHQDALERHGIYIEHPDTTNTWSHWSIKAPGSGITFFIHRRPMLETVERYAILVLLIVLACTVVYFKGEVKLLESKLATANETIGKQQTRIGALEAANAKNVEDIAACNKSVDGYKTAAMEASTRAADAYQKAAAATAALYTQAKTLLGQKSTGDFATDCKALLQNLDAEKRSRRSP